MGVLLAALVASAATSAVFLTVRREPPPVDPIQQKIDASKQIAQALASELAPLAKAHVASAESPAFPKVDVTFRTHPPEAAGDVPMVAPEDNMLMKAAPTPWELEVATAGARRRFNRIIEIRDSSSVLNPGYIGVVEVLVETAQRQLAFSGEIPVEPPHGFQVITSAKYTELEGSQQFNVRPASHQADERRYTFDDWVPATPPPAELPEEVRRQFNQAIVECSSTEPTHHVSTERLTFFYSLRERKWMPRP
jgi:hypothetical protein